MTTDPEEKEGPLDLQSLRTSETVPPALEDRVLSALRNRGLIQRRHERLPWKRLLLAAAACSAFFILGFFAARFKSAPSTTVSMSDSTYVLFLLEGSQYRTPADERQLEERIEAYRDWAVNLRKQGIPISGTKLRDEKNLLSNGTPGKRDEEITGYFLIDAKNYDQAEEIAGKCPHLKYGGVIEIRRVHPV